ncbi:YheC/YheD family protein [Halalkalibacter krulwichiae]|uniref:Endospore coat-associated protein YheD n=1 Tax=Halalkalibacter krulwichiae TaxID=199441 RepID=A0A1X9MKB6_9BACI|nr:YheC/YheD family protein [Halalkalibacter krulwichiae]ARK32091.1 Endospore coat-associated protein YheD [Halalkalibacter krulwichiae]
MFVGYLRSRAQPSQMAKLLAISCKELGIELIYLTPKDINISNHEITGKILIRNNWVTVKTQIPLFIDVTAYEYSENNRVVFEFLEKNTLLSDNRLNLGKLASSNPFIISKELMNLELEKYSEIEKYLIPTLRVENFKDIDNALNHDKKVVLKPINGLGGKGVYLVTKLDDFNYQVEYQTKTQNIDLYEFINLFENEFTGGKYILQKYIQSSTRQGDPFDCRVHLEKDGLGKWAIVKKPIRIGIGQKVISNVNQGGGIADCLQFLKANFNGRANEINEKLNYLGILIAQIVEKVRQTELMTLGLDIGISPEGELYLFEVNGAPAITFAPTSIAFTRTMYYQYVLNKEERRIYYGAKK